MILCSWEDLNLHFLPGAALAVIHLFKKYYCAGLRLGAGSTEMTAYRERQVFTRPQHSVTNMDNLGRKWWLLMRGRRVRKLHRHEVHAVP